MYSTSLIGFISLHGGTASEPCDFGLVGVKNLFGPLAEFGVAAGRSEVDAGEAWPERVEK